MEEPNVTDYYSELKRLKQSMLVLYILYALVISMRVLVLRFGLVSLLVYVVQYKQKYI